MNNRLKKGTSQRIFTEVSLNMDDTLTYINNIKTQIMIEVFIALADTRKLNKLEF